MAEKQPEIYKYLDDKFTEAREYNDKKFSEIYNKIGEMKTDIQIMKNREQPSYPCRCYMDSVRHAIEENEKGIKYDINNIAIVNDGRYKEVKKDIDKKVSYGFFWKLIGTSFAFTCLSFAFTWGIYLILK